MAGVIVRFMDGDTPLYCEWSTIADAPRTFLMPLDEFKVWYAAEYGRAGVASLPDRLKWVDLLGDTDARWCNVEDLLATNRAGLNGTRLTLGELIEQYRWKPSKTP